MLTGRAVLPPRPRGSRQPPGQASGQVTARRRRGSKSRHGRGGYKRSHTTGEPHAGREGQHASVHSVSIQRGGGGGMSGLLCFSPELMVAARQYSYAVCASLLPVVVGLIVGVWLYVDASAELDATEHSRFAAQQVSVSAALSGVVAANVHGAALLTAFMNSRCGSGTPETPAYGEFDIFAETTAQDADMHVQALEFAPHVMDDTERAQWEAATRTNTGIPDVVFKQPNASGVGLVPRDPDTAPYFPVAYVFPLAGNEPALLFDLGSSSTRAAAMSSAASSTKGVASAPIKLVQGDPGTLVLQPVYSCDVYELVRAGSDPSPVVTSHQDARVLGFVVAVYRVQKLLNGAVASLLAAHPQLAVRVSDEGQVLFGQQAQPEAWEGLSVTWSLPFVGREWEVILSATGSFTSAEEQQHVWTQLFVPIAIGLLVSIALMVNAALMHRQGLRLTRAAINATERTHKYLIDYLCHEVRNPLQACLSHIDLAVPCLEAMVVTETPRGGEGGEGGAARAANGAAPHNGAGCKRGNSAAVGGAGAGAGASSGPWGGDDGAALEQVGVALVPGSSSQGGRPAASGGIAMPQLALAAGSHAAFQTDLPDILTDLNVARMAVTQVALVLDGIMNTKWWVETEGAADKDVPDDSSTSLVDAASVLAPAVVRDVGLILRDLSNQYRSVIDPGVVLYLQLPVQTREARLDSQKLRQVVEFGLRKAVNSANSGYISLRGGIVRPFFHRQDETTPASRHSLRSTSGVSPSSAAPRGVAPASPAVRVATVSSPRRGDWFMCTVEFTPDVPLTQEDVDWGTHQELDGRARLGARVVGALTGALRGTLAKEPSAKLPNNLLHAATGAHRVTMPGDDGHEASSSMAALVSRELRRRVGSSLPRPVCVAIVRAMGGVMGLQQTQLAQSGRDAVALARFWVAVPLDDGVRGPGSVDESSSEFGEDCAVQATPGELAADGVVGRAATALGPAAVGQVGAVGDNASSWDELPSLGEDARTKSVPRNLTVPDGGPRAASPAPLPTRPTRASQSFHAASAAEAAAAHDRRMQVKRRVRRRRKAGGVRVVEPLLKDEVVAVVDDEPLIRKTTCRFLQRADVRTVSFEDGRPLLSEILGTRSVATRSGSFGSSDEDGSSQVRIDVGFTGTPTPRADDYGGGVRGGAAAAAAAAAAASQRGGDKVDGVTIVLLDIIMRTSNGVHVCQQLRAGGFTLPVFAMTANSDPASRAVYMAAGFDGVLAKPFTKKQLLSVLRKGAEMRKTRVASPANGQLRAAAASTEQTGAGK